jgi:hydroxyacylglutathione hydrolase
MVITQIVNTVFSSNTYILSNETDQNCWLVDCGDVDPIINWIQKYKKKLAGIFLTHTHFDHIYGLNQIVEVFPECRIYTSINGEKGLFSEKLNFSRYNGTNFVFKHQNVVILHDNDNIKILSDTTLSVIYTPGHDWSCITYNSGNNLFTGDSYLPDYKVITNFPKSDKSLAKQSLNKIYDMISLGVKEVFPGHGSILNVLSK